MNASEEEQYNIASAATPFDDEGKILQSEVEVRFEGNPSTVVKNKVDFMDVSANQAFSIATSMIPFLNHDDANRALMASNMQRQATALHCAGSADCGDRNGRLTLCETPEDWLSPKKTASLPFRTAPE